MVINVAEGGVNLMPIIPINPAALIIENNTTTKVVMELNILRVKISVVIIIIKIMIRVNPISLIEDSKKAVFNGTSPVV